MKICVYVVEKNAKLNYAQESYDVRLNAGMAVVVDILRRSGYHVDYAGIAKKHGLDAKLSNNVETHIVTVTIGGEIPSTLTNLIRYFATYAYPTRRMYPTSVDVINPDTKPLIEPVFIQISEMKFAHDCPLNEGNFLITHDKVFTEPLLVTAKYLKEA